MSSYEPDPKTAKLFARHKQATETIKETRKPVLTAAEEAIRNGATNPELAALTGMSDETFRKLAERIGVDNRLKPPTVGREAQARRATTAEALADAPVATPGTPRLPGRIAALSDKQALELCERAYAFANERQASELDNLTEEDGPEHARAVIAAAMAFNPPLLLDSDLRTV